MEGWKFLQILKVLFEPQIYCSTTFVFLIINNLFLLGWVLIDRCGKHFGAILNFLRDGIVPLPESSKETAELLAEAKYYCILELASACEAALLKKERDAEPICRVPLITSQKEEQLLINSTSKVIHMP